MTFVIEKPQFDPATGTVRFSYRLDELQFAETLRFPSGFEAEAAETASFALLLDLAAAVLGTSYFKLTAPEQIKGDGVALTPAQQSLVRDVYENGLGEFYARNQLSRFGKIGFDFAEATPASAPSLGTRILLPIGGGKDSLVSVQLLEHANADFTPFAVNPKGPILTSVDRIGKPPLYITRTLDPEMIRLAKQPGYFDGHVPVTAINSMIAGLTALLFGYGTIILSNERSASEGNQVHDGREVNHQHSKSLDAERLIAAALAETTGGALTYFSLLRPYSETRIASLFAEETRFDRVFSSCNRNFRLAGHEGELWCGDCPKCHFVFLILAPFMASERLNAIFGQNLLDQSRHLDAYRELAGLAGQKPWECVGEILEAAASLYRLTSAPAWSGTAIVKTLHDELLKQYGAQKLESAWTDLMRDSDTHLVPDQLAAKVAKNAA